MKPSSDLFILTGAGFTKNFGGLLGQDIWLEIFNNSRIQASPKIKNVLGQESNFNFERAYSTVIKSRDFTQGEKILMRDAIEAAYKKLDEATRSWIFTTDGQYPVNRYALSTLFGLFRGDSNTQGYFFTINQDIFMERKWGYRSPGAPWFKQELYSGHQGEFTSSDFIIVPSVDVEQKIKSAIDNHQGTTYIKLHGSYGWRTADGTNSMIVGTNKEEDIEGIPILRAYFDIFRKVIAEGNKKILIIGYGFADQHINRILLKGIKEHGLKLHLITTMSPKDLHNHFQFGHYYAAEIEEGIERYYQNPLSEIFTGAGHNTPKGEEIGKALLGQI